MAPLKLYHNPISPFSRAALITIRYLNLDVEVQVINLVEKEQLEDWYLKLNPLHTVPTLDDNGFVIYESRVIATYLVNSKSPGSALYPTDPKKRAVIDQRLYFTATILGPRGGDIVYPILFGGQTTIPADKKAKFHEAVGFVEGFLKKSKWLAGDLITLADLTFMPLLIAFVCAGLKLDKYPQISRWIEACKNIPGYDENMIGCRAFGDLVKKNLKDTWE